MAGHIFLISCLLAICLPIVFVQLPRFETIKNLRAENEVEKRSEILRRRPLSPSQKALRWIKRPWSETDIDIKGAVSEQEQIDHEQIPWSIARGRRVKGYSNSLFGADACADDGASSKEEELRNARAGKKPWDPPFRRSPRTELVGKSPSEGWHTLKDAPQPRKTGREMKAAGIAVRLFPPDPVPELGGVDDYHRSSRASSSMPQTPQEPLYRKPPPKMQVLSRMTRHGPSHPRAQSKTPSVQSTPQQLTDIESLPSPLDGSHCHTSQDNPSVKLKECCSSPCRCSSSSLTNPRSQNTSSVEVFDDLKDCPKESPERSAKESSKRVIEGAHEEVVKMRSKGYLTRFPIWQVLLMSMGFVVFVITFAVLIAHCLAWFLVYKTEARLGEVRSGLLRGGEMKLCLCGKG